MGLLIEPKEKHGNIECVSCRNTQKSSPPTKTRRDQEVLLSDLFFESIRLHQHEFHRSKLLAVCEGSQSLETLTEGPIR